MRRIAIIGVAVGLVLAACSTAEPEVVTSIVYVEASTTSTTTTSTTTTTRPPLPTTTTTIDYAARDEATMDAEDNWWAYVDTVEMALIREGFEYMLPLDVDEALETGWLLCDFMTGAQANGLTPLEAFEEFFTITMESFSGNGADLEMYGITYSGTSIMAAAAYLCPENEDFADEMAWSG